MSVNPRVSAPPLRLALIGCGSMGSYYAHNISKREDAQIVICCDPSPDKLNSFRENWSIPECCTDWHWIFNTGRTGAESAGIDAVIGCTIDSLRGEIFQACLTGGIPLFTEKPFAVPFEVLKEFSPEQLLSQPLGINFSKRCLPPVAAVRDFIRQGGLGRLNRMELHYRQGWALNHDFGDWHRPSPWFWRLTSEISHHGVLGDLGSHLFDLALFLAGPPSTLSCRLAVTPKDRDRLNGYALDSPDEALCMLEMKSGLPVLINATRTAVGEKDGLKIMISGEKGSVEISPEENREGYRFHPVGGEWQTVPCPGRPRRNHEHFLDLLSGEAPRETPGLREALINHVLIEAAVESDRKARSIDIEAFASERLGEIWAETTR